MRACCATRCAPTWRWARTRKPAENAAPGTVVLWEKFGKWPSVGLNVGFVDGAVMRVAKKDVFERMLKGGR